MNEREIAMVLCGLRMLQNRISVEPGGECSNNAAAAQMILNDEGFGDITAAEIDTLCEKINFS